TAKHPEPPETSEQLRARIPGWGADLDPKDRPGTPKEHFDPDATGAHWEFPDRMPDTEERERSIEHKFLTPVYGTAQPLHGVSGKIRRYAYTFSEGRTAHWLLLMLGDRVDVLGGRFEAIRRGKPDNPIAEKGIIREFKNHGYRSRFGQHRADLKHQPIDIVMWMAPYAALGVGLYYGVKA